MNLVKLVKNVSTIQIMSQEIRFYERRCEVLQVLIIPENMRRGDRILEAICRIETDPIAEYDKKRMRIRTYGGTTYTVVRPDVRYLVGHGADQVIFDFAFINTLKDVVSLILCSSCVPEEFQIIDDRKILI